MPRGRTVQNPAVADQVFATEYTQKTCRLKLAAIPPAKLWRVVTTGSRHEKKTAPIEDAASPLDEDRITKVPTSLTRNLKKGNAVKYYSDLS